MKFNRWFAILALGVMSLLIATPGKSQSAKFSQEPACQTLKPASTGGPLPQNPDVLLVRYLGRANYEVAFRGKVLLLDTYYDNSRVPYASPFGVKESDI